MNSAVRRRDDRGEDPLTPGRERLGWRRMLTLVAGLYFVLIGGSELGVVAFPIQVINTIIAGWLVMFWLRNIGRDRDRIDVAAAIVIVSVALVTAASELPRFSIDGAMGAVGWAACFYCLRRWLGDPLLQKVTVRIMGLVGGTLAVALCAAWLSTWWNWWEMGGAGIPPLDMRLPVGPYRGTHVAVMLLGLLAPAVWSLRKDRLSLVFWVSVPAIAVAFVLSGARGAWLSAVVATGLILLGRPLRPLRISRRRVSLGAAAGAVVVSIGVVAGAVPALIERLTTISTLEARLRIWGAAVRIVEDGPLFGSGLGTFVPKLALSGYFDTSSFAPRHADNAYVQLAAEGGIVMVVTVSILTAFVARQLIADSPRTRLSAWALIFAAFASLTDNPTDSGNLVLIMVVWAALATHRSAHIQGVADTSVVAPRLLRRAVVTGLAAVVALEAVGSAAYELGKRAHQTGNDHAAIQAFVVASSVDPGLALYRRDLGLLRLEQGDLVGVHDLSAASIANPADDVILRALALEASASQVERAAWATKAIAVKRSSLPNLLTAWLVTSDEGYLAEALWLHPWLMAAGTYQEQMVGSIDDDLLQLLNAHRDRFPTDHADIPTRRAWLRAFSGVPAKRDPADLQAFGALMRCELLQAEDLLGQEEKPSVWWVAVRRELGREAEEAASRLAIWDPRMRMAAVGSVDGELATRASVQDRVFYRRIPATLGGLGPEFPTAVEGQSRWMSDPRGAASSSGAPGPYPEC